MTAEDCVKMLSAAARIIKQHDGPVLVIESQEMGVSQAGGFFAAPGEDGRSLIIAIAPGHPLLEQMRELVRLDS